MDIRRVILFGLLIVIGFSLWNQWQIESIPQQATHNETGNKSSVPNPPSVDVGANDELAIPVKKDEITNKTKSNDGTETISIKSNVLTLKIDLLNGDIIQSKLNKFPISIQNSNPFILLNDTDDGYYAATNNLLYWSNKKLKKADIKFSSSKSQYNVTDSVQSIVLKGNTKDGLEVNKIFTIHPDRYLIDVEYRITNPSQSVWKGYTNSQLVRHNPPDDSSSLFHIGSYTGASYSNPDKNKYKKVSFKDMEKRNLSVDVNSGWIAMQQHYFLSAWIPQKDSKNRFYTRVDDNDNYVVGVVSNPISVSPGKTKVISESLYIGPEDAETLKAIAPSLDLTIDYGWLWFISSLLFVLMKGIYTIVGNWGWSIVLVTVLIKLAFYRLSATSYRSMAAMRKLQPKLQALKEKYGDDKAKISQATMELYRQDKVNPLGGCLPIIIQIPVFIALYWVLLESVELRQAPFIFWIKDLASADPYHILPIIMGLTMLIQQRLNPAPQDPTQAKVMMFLPVIFTALFWSFPAGLVLYWVVNNSLSILQQWYITQKFEKKS